MVWRRSTWNRVALLVPQLRVSTALRSPRERLSPSSRHVVPPSGLCQHRSTVTRRSSRRPLIAILAPIFFLNPNLHPHQAASR